MTLLGSSTSAPPFAGCPKVSRRYSAPLSVACRSATTPVNGFPPACCRRFGCAGSCFPAEDWRMLLSAQASDS